jgi:hypothetical protein
VAIKASGLMQTAPDACRRALVDLPGAIVWELARPAA